MAGRTVRDVKVTLEELFSGSLKPLAPETFGAPALQIAPGEPTPSACLHGKAYIIKPTGSAPGTWLETDYYSVMSQPGRHDKSIQVSRTANSETIKKARDNLMMRYHEDKCFGDEEMLQIGYQINKAFETLSDPEKKSAYDNPNALVHGAAAAPREWKAYIVLEPHAERKLRLGDHAAGPELHRVSWDQCVKDGISPAKAIEMKDKLYCLGLWGGDADQVKVVARAHKEGSDLLLIKRISYVQALGGLDTVDAQVQLPGGRCETLRKADGRQLVTSGDTELFEGAGLPKYRGRGGEVGRLVVEYQVDLPDPAFVEAIERAAVAGEELLCDALPEIEKGMKTLDSEIQAERRAWKATAEERLVEKQELVKLNMGQEQLIQQLKLQADESSKSLADRLRDLLPKNQEAPGPEPKVAGCSLPSALLGSYEVATARVQVYEDAHCTKKYHESSSRSMGKRKIRLLEKGDQFDVDCVGFGLADGRAVVTLRCMVTHTDSTRSLYGWIKHDATSLRMTSETAVHQPDKHASDTDKTAREATTELETSLLDARRELADTQHHLETTQTTLSREIKAKDQQLAEVPAKLAAVRAEVAEVQAKLDSALRDRREDTDWGRRVLQVVVDSGVCPAELLSNILIDQDTASCDVRSVRKPLLDILESSIKRHKAAAAQSKTGLDSFSKQVHQRASKLLSVPVARSEHPVSRFPDSCSGMIAHLDHAVACTLEEFKRREAQLQEVQEDVAQQKQNLKDTQDNWQRATRAGTELTARDARLDGYNDEDCGVVQAMESLQQYVVRARSVTGLEDLGNMVGRPMRTENPMDGMPIPPVAYRRVPVLQDSFSDVPTPPASVYVQPRVGVHVAAVQPVAAEAEPEPEERPQAQPIATSVRHSQDTSAASTQQRPAPPQQADAGYDIFAGVPTVPGATSGA